MIRRNRRRREPQFWGIVVTIFVPLSTLALVLLGYGYSLAVELVFGLDSGLVAGTLAEYLQLSGHVIMHLLTTLSDQFRRWDIVVRIYSDLLWWVFVGLTMWVGVFVLWVPRVYWLHWSARLGGETMKAVAAYRHWEPTCIAPVRRTLFKPLGKLWNALIWLGGWVSTLPSIFWWGSVSLIGILGWPLISLVTAACVLTLIGMVYSFAPFIGMTVGASFLNEWVIKPSACLTARSRDRRLVDLLPGAPDKPSVAGAQCVCVVKDGKVLARGRLVASTAGAIVLFDPIGGVVQRVPLADATIRVVDSLE